VQFGKEIHVFRIAAVTGDRTLGVGTFLGLHEVEPVEVVVTLAETVLHFTLKKE
jgi:hypothetical protein